MRLFLLFISVCFLFSCEPFPAASPFVRHKIKSLTIKWANNAPDHDNIDFFYDISGRVSHIIGHNGEYGASLSATDTIFKFVFYYHGTDSLPYLSILASLYNATATGEYEYDYLFYDSQKRVTQDSIRFNPPYSPYYLFNYEYHPDFILSDLDTLRIAGGNYVSFSPLGFSNNYRWQVEFDDKFNPLNLLNIAPVYNSINKSKNPNQSEWSVWSLSNYRNQTNIWYGLIPLSSTPNDKLSYTYDSDGFPVERIWRDGATNAVKDTLVYNYN